MAYSAKFVPKSVQKCARTSHASKQAACTHIAHTFQNEFRTQTHKSGHTSHVCVCGRTFATHPLHILWHLFHLLSRSGAGGFSSRKSGFRTDRTDTEHEDNDHRPGNVGKSAYFSSASIPASCSKLLNMFRKITFLFTQLSNSSDSFTNSMTTNLRFFYRKWISVHTNK